MDGYALNHSSYFFDLEKRYRYRGGYVVKTFFEQAHVFLPMRVELEEAYYQPKEFFYEWDAKKWLWQISTYFRPGQSFRHMLETFDPHAQLYLMDEHQVIRKLSYLLVDRYVNAYVIPNPYDDDTQTFYTEHSCIAVAVPQRIKKQNLPHVLHNPDEQTQWAGIWYHHDDRDLTPVRHLPFQLETANGAIYRGVLDDFGRADISLPAAAAGTAQFILGCDDNVETQIISTRAKLKAAIDALIEEQTHISQGIKQSFDEANLLVKFLKVKVAEVQGMGDALADYYEAIETAGTIALAVHQLKARAWQAVLTGDIDGLEALLDELRAKGEYAIEEAGEFFERLSYVIRDQASLQLLVDLPTRYLNVLHLTEKTRLASAAFYGFAFDILIAVGTLGRGTASVTLAKYGARISRLIAKLAELIKKTKTYKRVTGKTQFKSKVKPATKIDYDDNDRQRVIAKYEDRATAKAEFDGKVAVRGEGIAPNKNLGGAGGNWQVIDEVADSSVIKQVNDLSCGQACVAMMLGDRKIKASQSVVAKLAGDGPTYEAQLAAVMNKLDSSGSRQWMGAGVDATDVGTFHGLSSTGSWGAQLWEKGNKIGHWVVVDGLDDVGRVMIRDPWQATKYKMDLTEFQNTWTGYSVWGQ